MSYLTVQEGAVSVPPALGELCVDSDHPDSPLHTRLCWKVKTCTCCHGSLTCKQHGASSYLCMSDCLTAIQILQSVSASFGGSSKRKTPLVAAVVSTLLLPAMFARHSDTDYTLLYPDLHEPGGPVQWAMTRLITWVGEAIMHLRYYISDVPLYRCVYHMCVCVYARLCLQTATSPRMALLVACQLSSLMLLQPSVISVYAQHIETLLLMPPGKPMLAQTDIHSHSGRHTHVGYQLSSSRVCVELCARVCVYVCLRGRCTRE